MRDTQQLLFNTLVEKLATGQAFDENGNPTPAWANGFEVLVEGVVTDDGGSMDDEELVTFTANGLGKILMKNARERAEFLATQAA